MKKDTIDVLITKKYIDHYKHVNHARYQDLFEDAQAKLLCKNDISFEDIERIHSVRFVQRAFSIEYFKPIFLDDQIIIETSISKVGSKSFTFWQKIIKDNLTITTAQTTYVAMIVLVKKYYCLRLSAI